MAVVTQTGNAGGLWTHTPVDWRGNETGGKPGNWPTDAVNGAQGLGTRPLEQMPAPGLTVLSSTPGSGTVTITWTTSVLSDSNIDLGVTTSYGQHYNDPTMTLTHSVAITGLLHSQLYNYRASSNGSGYSIVSANSTFTTLA
jgi:hypothetical protein